MPGSMPEFRPPYVPPLGIQYPENPGAHVKSLRIYDGRDLLIAGAKEIDLVMDENYPFWDRSPAFKFKNMLIYLGIFSLVFILSPLRFGLKIEGRPILRKYRDILKNGAMTASNHVHRWDLLFVLQAVRFRRLFLPVWYRNLETAGRGLIRSIGGIPIPSQSHLMPAFMRALQDLHSAKKWIHVYPESSNWLYYQPIRPFKKGVFTIAWDNNIPVLPLAISWRPAKGIFKLFKKNFPLVTVRIGEPVMPDKTRSRREAVQILRKQTHAKIVELAGIRDNPWPAEGD
ncbi:MAG: 1-acyl-sn-glycerol-3-phosphate acyltransferase [Treponema sp.]|nr:1-acyl-sn-glycerol-3-phosphate acyltransferase [Treponema sp.]